jgi:Helix-turn-helix domain
MMRDTALPAAQGPELNLHKLSRSRMPDHSMPETSLSVRLRNERERRQIPLSSISANTKISSSLFEALERGDVSRWPSGIFRRSFIRAYASAIGLDPDAVAREFLEQFPDPLEPPRVTVAAPPVAMTAPITGPAATGAAANGSGLRLKLADAPTPFVPGRLLTGMRHRWAAVACDGGFVLAVALCVFVACDKFWLPLGIAMIGYYVGGILLLGNSPGVCLLAPGAADEAHYNRPPDDNARADGHPGAHSDWHFRVPAR